MNATSIANTLILGGCRSGKSNYAEQLVQGSDLRPVYIATCRHDIHDDGMRSRIEAHRERRSSTALREWETIEEPLALADAIRNSAFQGSAVLVDCLTLWVSNLMEAGANIERECNHLVNTLAEVRAPVVMVSNEVGLGIVPENKLARAFRDESGMVNQKVAAGVDQVWFIAAGLPLKLKG